MKVNIIYKDQLFNKTKSSGFLNKDHYCLVPLLSSKNTSNKKKYSAATLKNWAQAWRIQRVRM